MKNVAGKNVLITGGAAGIGKLMAQKFLQRDAQVVLWDLNEKAMEETRSELSALGSVKAYQVDLASPEAIRQAANLVKQEVGKIDVLINNAGIVVGKYFKDHTFSDITKTMEVNALAPMLVTLEFLPDMLDADSGHICTIASSAGIVSNPKMAVYAASKWAAVGWSDSLRLEMEQLNKKVQVTTIMPYYISTGMFAGVHSRLPILKPDYAASVIVRAILKDKKMITIPAYIYYLTRISQGIFPLSWFDWITGNIFGIYKTMDHFTGHQKK